MLLLSTPEIWEGQTFGLHLTMTRGIIGQDPGAMDIELCGVKEKLLR